MYWNIERFTDAKIFSTPLGLDISQRIAVSDVRLRLKTRSPMLKANDSIAKSRYSGFIYLHQSMYYNYLEMKSMTKSSEVSLIMHYWQIWLVWNFVFYFKTVSSVNCNNCIKHIRKWGNTFDFLQMVFHVFLKVIL